MTSTQENIRKTKREHMARVRAANPDLARKKQADWRAANLERERERMRAYQKKRFFWIRSMRLRQSGKATPSELSKKWKRQRGRCALTGVKLNRSAELDHITPKSRGGGDNIQNLRWVTKGINRIKRDLMDSEFFELCALVHSRHGRVTTNDF